jgi:SAM-dependent methyltransferase
MKYGIKRNTFKNTSFRVKIALMENQEYEQMFLLENSHWFFKGRKAIIESIVSTYLASGHGKILDIGCGTGGITSVLGKFGEVYGIDSSITALDFCKKQEIKNVYLLGSDGRFPFEDNFLMQCVLLMSLSMWTTMKVFSPR